MMEITTRDAGRWQEPRSHITKTEDLPMTELQKQLDDMPDGQHFWGILDGKLCVMMYDNRGYCYVCGGWEVPVTTEKVVSLIDIPEGYTVNDLYFL